MENSGKYQRILKNISNILEKNRVESKYLRIFLTAKPNQLESFSRGFVSFIEDLNLKIMKLRIDLKS